MTNRQPKLNKSITLTQEQIDAIQAQADKEQRNWTDMVRVLIDRGLRV